MNFYQKRNAICDLKICGWVTPKLTNYDKKNFSKTVIFCIAYLKSPKFLFQYCITVSLKITKPSSESFLLGKRIHTRIYAAQTWPFLINSLAWEKNLRSGWLLKYNGSFSFDRMTGKAGVAHEIRIFSWISREINESNQYKKVMQKNLDFKKRNDVKIPLNIYGKANWSI